METTTTKRPRDYTASEAIAAWEAERAARVCEHCGTRGSLKRVECGGGAAGDVYLCASAHAEHLRECEECEPEFDEETMCGVLVDLDSRCGKPITSVVEEPWTPGRFQIECCEDCAKYFISEGYHDRGERK